MIAMIVAMGELFSFYGDLIYKYPWWFTTICILLHFFAVRQCIRMDNGDLLSSQKLSHNTIHTLFWLIIILMVPFAGTILYLIFSVSVYSATSKSKENSINTCKLFLGNCSNSLISLWSKIIFTVKSFRNKEQIGINPVYWDNNINTADDDGTNVHVHEVKVRAVNSSFILFVMFAICIFVSIYHNVERDISGIAVFDKVPFELAFVMFSLITIHDWLRNYNGVKLYFRIRSLNGVNKWELGEDILGKSHFIERDFCVDNNAVSPEALKKTVDKIMPEICSSYAIFSAVSNCINIDKCTKIEGNDNFAIEILDPTYDFDSLDMKEVTQTESLGKHITRYVYLDWYAGENYLTDDDDPDIKCLERTIYSATPKFRYLFVRALIYFIIIVMMFTPIYYSINTFCLNILDSVFGVFL